MELSARHTVKAIAATITIADAYAMTVFEEVKTVDLVHRGVSTAKKALRIITCLRLIRHLAAHARIVDAAWKKLSAR
jgi:hypothetical protein